MLRTSVVVLLIGCVSLLYSPAAQAGLTAFIAVMAVAGLSAFELRPTALLRNIFAVRYPTTRSQSLPRVRPPMSLTVCSTTTRI